MRSYNDDLVIATCIGCWVRDTALVTNKRDVEYKKALLTGISVSNTTFSTKIDGQIGHKHGNSFKGTDGRTHDLGWIIKG